MGDIGEIRSTLETADGQLAGFVGAENDVRMRMFSLGNSINSVTLGVEDLAYGIPRLRTQLTESVTTQHAALSDLSESAAAIRQASDGSERLGFIATGMERAENVLVSEALPAITSFDTELEEAVHMLMTILGKLKALEGRTDIVRSAALKAADVGLNARANIRRYTDNL